MEFFGLPLHPLVVHGAVVLVPLAALGALAVLASAWVRTRYGWLVAIGAAAGAGAAVTARIAGEALAQRLGGGGTLVAAHQVWGTWAPFPAVALALLLPATLLLERRARPAWRVLGVLTAVVAVAALGLVVMAGHTGATAVWGS